MFGILHHKPLCMLRFKFIFLCGLLLMGSAALPGQTRYSEQDSLVKSTWTAFTKAVKAGDIQGFRALSADCIYCPWCARNTPQEDSVYKRLLNVQGRTGYEQHYPSNNTKLLETFIKEDYSLIFTKAVKKRLGMEANALFTPISYFPELLQQDCAAGQAKAPHAELIEVLLPDLNVSRKKAGPSLAFVFVKQENAYKFCAFALAPE